MGDVEYGGDVVAAHTGEERAAAFELGQVDGPVFTLYGDGTAHIDVVGVDSLADPLDREDRRAGGGESGGIPHQHVAVKVESVGAGIGARIVGGVGRDELEVLARGGGQFRLYADVGDGSVDHNGSVQLVPGRDVGVAIEDVDVDLVDDGIAFAVIDDGTVLVEHGVSHPGFARLERGQSGAADRRESGVRDRKIFGVGDRLGKVYGVVLGVAGDVADPVVIQSELGVVENDGDRVGTAAGHQDDGGHQYREYRDHGQNPRHKLFGFCHKVLLYDVVRAM